MKERNTPPFMEHCTRRGDVRIAINLIYIIPLGDQCVDGSNFELLVDTIGCGCPHVLSRVLSFGASVVTRRTIWNMARVVLTPAAPEGGFRDKSSSIWGRVVSSGWVGYVGGISYPLTGALSFLVRWRGWVVPVLPRHGRLSKWRACDLTQHLQCSGKL